MSEMTIEEMKKDKDIVKNCLVEDRFKFLKDNGYKLTKSNMLNSELSHKERKNK